MRKSIYIFLAIAFAVAAIIDGQRFLGNSNIDEMAEEDWRWVNIIDENLEVEYDDYLLLGNVFLLQMDMGFCPEQPNFRVEFSNKALLNFDEYTPKLITYRTEPNTYYYAFDNLPTGNYKLTISTDAIHFDDNEINISDEYNQYNRFYLSDYFSAYYNQNFNAISNSITEVPLEGALEIHYNRKNACAFSTIEVFLDESSDSVQMRVRQNDWEKIVLVHQDSIKRAFKDLEFHAVYKSILQNIDLVEECDDFSTEYLTFISQGLYHTHEYENCYENNLIENNLRIELDKILDKFINAKTPEETQEL